MPFLAAGLHLAVVIFFAVHAVRRGHSLYWIVLMLSFPLVGCLVYFLAVYLPDSRLPRHAGKLAGAVVKGLDPTRELRAAQADYDYAPTAQSQMRLAQSLLACNQPQAALGHFEACLQGVFSDDMEIRWGAAQAARAAGEAATCIGHLQVISDAAPRFRPAEVRLLLALAYADLGDAARARAAFEESIARDGSFESRAEYAIWAMENGDLETARRLRMELEQSMQRWSREQRRMRRELLGRLTAVFDGISS
ncbi:hypothetical protein [Corticimicrobacter populi]|uniref:Cardiolipin synthase N-terminal domain-containing protein n=1 Tax=Corticimicrobacter populi TaxID=2175229 RepID=A0A2V1JYI9_9BURK|nr:hypothetical protein [Corticimicrobacter populi]PWF22544.1 hypothetical protein DD235_10670 [Corticimicrobacter populi]